MQPGVRYALIVTSASLWLAACSGVPQPVATGMPTSPAVQGGYPGPTPEGIFQTPEVPSELPAPQSGTAVVGGALYSFTTNMLLPGTLIYLTPAVGTDQRGIPPVITGPDETKGDVRGQTNDRGQFVFADVPPGNYYLVVSAPLSWSLGMAAAEAEEPLLIELEENEVRSVGIVYVSWP